MSQIQPPSALPEQSQDTTADDMPFVDIALPVPVHHSFTYALPAELAPLARPGMRVRVPFHRRELYGIITATNTKAPQHARCKDIHEICDEEPALSLHLLELGLWISRYYAAPIGEVCRAMLPAALMKKTKKSSSTRLAPAHEGQGDFGVAQPPTLTDEQATAAAAITTALRRRQFHTSLLQGVTGSGKTEVYFAAIAEALARDQHALLMLPEIGLTPQLLDRLYARFGEKVAVYHSGLTEAQRSIQWQRMITGEAQICCGTRSAVFAPLSKLSLIILDEEHDASYKQEDAPHYHGRDVAIVRAQMLKAVAVLGSATPSLESCHNVARGKYEHLVLSKRPGQATLPSVELIDMREEPASNDTSGILSKALRAAMQAAMDRNEQCLLFLNRRGFSPAMQCRSCGHSFDCPNCDISLTLHKGKNSMQCHYCEYFIARPKDCPSCEDPHLKAMGTGTERIEDALAEHFPDARIARLDKDTSTKRTARQKILRAMRKGEIDILVGTQMITKGHDFPNVTVVGVINADLSLHIPDFRAAERTFQQITQVAGRAGRADQPGRVLIQTCTPEHYSLQSAQQHDFEAFRKAECEHRQELGYPPYGRLINVRFASNIESKAVDYATALRKALDTQLGASGQCQLLGPAPAARSKVAGKHRWHLLLKTTGPTKLQHFTHSIRAHANQHAPSGVHVAIDVDPVNLM